MVRVFGEEGKLCRKRMRKERRGKEREVRKWRRKWKVGKRRDGKKIEKRTGK